MARVIRSEQAQQDLEGILDYRFIRRKRAPGLKEMDMLIPIGVA